MPNTKEQGQLFSLDDYDYHLPDALIAQTPSLNREGSRLLVFEKLSKRVSDTMFIALANLIPKNSLIIVNNSKVVPARIVGTRKTGSSVEMLLMTPVALLEKSAKQMPYGDRIHNDILENHALDNVTSATQAQNATKVAQAEVLLKGSKRVKINEELVFPKLRVVVLEKKEFGQHTVELCWTGDLVKILEEYGSLPLPPYIKRPDGPSQHDLNRYQTIFANQGQAGSVAAPTAGLHFTKEIQEKLLANGCFWEEVTLHVGYGTFSPVRAMDIREHDMHAEYVEIPSNVAKAVLAAKKEKRPIFAVGTTATRTLEGMAQLFALYKQTKATERADNTKLKNFHFFGEANTVNTEEGVLPQSGCFGFTNIFIYPGKQFNVIDGLLTNFHLPKSSLLMLVSAFAGYENTKKLYQHAIKEQYRFFSYGDAMLIKP